MTVLEERVGASRSDPHAILTPLEWLGCGGRNPLEESPVKVCRVQACFDMTAGVTECTEIVARGNRIRELEQALKDVTLQDAEIDCRNRSDKEARQWVESSGGFRGGDGGMHPPHQPKSYDFGRKISPYFE